MDIWPSRKNTTFTNFCGQGGQFTDQQIEEAKKDPLLEAKLAVRKWDDLAKDPDMKVPGLDVYKAMAINSLAGKN